MGKKYPFYGWEDEIIYAVPKSEANSLLEQMHNLDISADLDDKVISTVDVEAEFSTMGDLELDFDYVTGKFHVFPKPIEN